MRKCGRLNEQEKDKLIYCWNDATKDARKQNPKCKSKETRKQIATMLPNKELGSKQTKATKQPQNNECKQANCKNPCLQNC